MRTDCSVFSVSGDYAAPQVQVIDVCSEGMLCTSGTIEEWGEDEMLWD